jgi:hypothetical protein
LLATAPLRFAWREKTKGLRLPAAKGPRSLSDFSRPLEKLRFSPDPSDPPEDLPGLRYPFGLTPFQGRGPRSLSDFLVSLLESLRDSPDPTGPPRRPFRSSPPLLGTKKSERLLSVP